MIATTLACARAIKARGINLYAAKVSLKNKIGTFKFRIKYLARCKFQIVNLTLESLLLSNL